MFLFSLFCNLTAPSSGRQLKRRHTGTNDNDGDGG
uniref:Uncharacterized protein n=1 Tax=Rhizophora mucronata TaxID=61149 RepID=A0A2P2PI68_RHIMU